MTDRFAVEPEKLWKAGAVDLPQAAAAFAEGAVEIHKTGSSESGAFKRSSGGMGELYPQWSRLRETLQNGILSTTHDNLVKAGEALTQLADSYAADDENTMDTLRKYKDTLHEASGDPQQTDSAASQQHQADTYLESDHRGEQ